MAIIAQLCEYSWSIYLILPMVPGNIVRRIRRALKFNILLSQYLVKVLIGHISIIRAGFNLYIFCILMVIYIFFVC